MREGPSRRSFLAAVAAALFGWLGKSPPETRAVAPNPPAPPPVVPQTPVEPLGAVTTYSYDCVGTPLLHGCDPTGRCATLVYDSQAGMR